MGKYRKNPAEIRRESPRKTVGKLKKEDTGERLTSGETTKRLLDSQDKSNNISCGQRVWPLSSLGLVFIVL